MVRGLAGFAVSFSLVAACTTFGVADTGDDGGVVPSPSTSESARPPLPPILRPDGAAPLPIDGGPPTPLDSGPRPEAGAGDRRIALVTLVAPSAAAMIAKCKNEVGPNFVPFVARDGMLPSAQYAPDNRRIVLFSNSSAIVAPSLGGLETNGAMTTILLKDGGTPSSGTHVWTGLGASSSAVGETCGNWASTNGNGTAGIYNAPGRRTVFAEGKTCEAVNTLMLYCVEY